MIGFRFHRVLNLLPGVRVNLSKSGVSTSLGPRGADVNIGRHGLTTNAGIPGTGLSYRSKPGNSGGMIGVLALVAGLGFAAYKNADKIAHVFAPSPPGTATTAVPTGASQATQPVNNSAIRFVHRGGSVLRETASASGAALKKEAKGAQVILLTQDGAWARVQDGDAVGWMRVSVLGSNPP